MKSDSLPPGVNRLYDCLRYHPLLHCFRLTLFWLSMLAAIPVAGQQFPAVSITIPTNGASFVAPAQILISANASDPDGTVASVRFYESTNLVGPDFSEPFSAVWSNGLWGIHTLTAVATDNQGNRATSSPVSVRILATTVSTLIAGETKNGAFTAAGQMDQYNFDANAGEEVMLQFKNAVGGYDPFIYLYAPDGSFVTNGSGFSSAVIWQQVLGQTGNYTVICFDSTSSGTNAYTLTLAKIVGANPADEDAATLVAGEVRKANFTWGDIDVVRFAGTAGEEIILQLKDAVGGYDPYIYLYAPDGTFVTSAGGFSSAVIWQQVLSQTGNYTVVCFDYYSSGTNAYTLTLAKIVGTNPADEDAATLVAGEVRQASFTWGDIDVFRFAGTAGEEIILQLKDAVGGYDPYISLYAPDGSFVTNGGGFSSAVIWQQVLSQTGNYTVVCFDYYSSGTNAYTLTLAKIVGANPADEDAATLVAGEVRQASFTWGDIDVFRFAGTAGEEIILQLKDAVGGYDPYISLYAPDGSFVTNGGGFSSAVIWQQVLSQTGNYTVVCFDYYSSGTNAYTLTLAKIVGANPADEDAATLVAGEVRQASFTWGDIDVFRFAGTAGEEIILQLKDAVGGYDPYISLYAPDGSFVTNGGGFSSAVIWQQVLSQTGNYTVVCFDYYSSGTNAYTLTLAKIVGANPADEDAATLVAGEVRQASFTWGDIDVFRFAGTAGEEIILQLKDAVGGYDPYISLYAPDGSFVTNGGGFSSAVIWQQVLSQTGNYTVVCFDYYSSGTNAYTLTLAKIVGANPADEDAATLVAGEVRQASFTWGDIDVFRFVGDADNVVSMQLASSGSFTYPSMYLYGPNGSAITYTGGGFGSTVTLQGVRLPATGTYTIVCLDSTSSGTNQYSLTLASAPEILIQPVSTNAIIGSTVAFSIVATSAPPPSYQWRRNGANIPGATNFTFIITNVQLTNGGSYSVVVATPFDAVTSDPVDLIVQVPFQARPQDNFASRETLAGTNGVALGTNLFATRESGEPLHAGKFGSNSVWYRWPAPTNGIATIKTVGSTFDTLLAVYTGATVSNLTLVAADEDQGGFFTSEIQFNAQSNVEYQIAIDGFAGQQGAFTLGWALEVTSDTLPVIINAPVSHTVTPGTTATFLVAAAGVGLHYQWYFNDMSIPGAINALLQITNAQPTNVGYYKVAITNSVGRGIVSVPAGLELGTEAGPVSLDKQEDSNFVPASVGIPGYFVSFGGIASHLWNNAVGTTSPGETNHCGVVNNATRWLYLTNSSGGNMVIHTKGSGIPTFFAVYVKQLFGHSPLPVACGVPNSSDGANVRRARFNVVAGTTYAVVADGLDSATGLIELNWALGLAPVVTNVYTNLVMSTGSRLVLSVSTVAGFPPPAYQWRLNGVSIAGATNATLTYESIGAGHEGVYSVLASNVIDLVESTVATVTVNRNTLRFCESTFDAAGDAWSLAHSALPLYFLGNGGNPSGCLAVSAGSTNETWYWSAPNLFLGNRSSAYGGWFQFDVKDAIPTATNPDEPLVLMSGGGTTLAYFEATTPGTNIAGWRTYRVRLAESPPSAEGRWFKTGWNGPLPSRQEMAQTLSSLTGLWLRGKATPFQIGKLDNVVLETSCTDNPPLLIRRLDTLHVALEWPASEFCYNLAAAATLQAPTWTTNLEGVVRQTTNGFNQVVAPAAGSTRFFRLIRTQ